MCICVYVCIDECVYIVWVYVCIYVYCMCVGIDECVYGMYTYMYGMVWYGMVWYVSMNVWMYLNEVWCCDLLVF